MIDISGKIFSRLKVIKFDAIKKRKTYWVCECECGNIVSYRGDLLKNGRRKSCGCINNPDTDEYIENIKKRLTKNSERKGTCLIWKNSLIHSGYGLFKIRSRTKLDDLSEKTCYGKSFTCGVHRVSYRVWNGKIPKGKFVLHKCDNRSCIEPSHLFLGDHHDNMKDMMGKGRQNKRPGEKHHMVKLTNEIVMEIRKRYVEEKLSQIQLGKLYNCSSITIHNIVKRKSWKHI